MKLKKKRCFVEVLSNSQINRVATSWKSPGFFSCPGKSLNFVYKSWKIFERFSHALPGQNSEVIITGTL